MASLLSDMKVFKKRLMEGVGGPEGLANITLSLLNSDGVSPMHKTKLLIETIGILRREEDAEPAQALDTLEMEELQALHAEALLKATEDGGAV